MEQETLLTRLLATVGELESQLAAQAAALEEQLVATAAASVRQKEVRAARDALQLTDAEQRAVLAQLRLRLARALRAEAAAAAAAATGDAPALFAAWRADMVAEARLRAEVVRAYLGYDK